jgi:hypothetical protein
MILFAFAFGKSIWLFAITTQLENVRFISIIILTSAQLSTYMIDLFLLMVIYSIFLLYSVKSNSSHFSQK